MSERKNRLSHKRVSKRSGRSVELTDAVSRFLLDCEVRSRTSYTLGTYRQRLGVLVKLLAEVCRVTDLEEVTIDHLRQCVQHLLTTPLQFERGRKPVSGGAVSVVTAKTYVVVWKGFFNWCYREELMEVNPAIRLTVPKVPVKVTETLTTEHIERMLSSFDLKTETGFRDYVMVILFLDTGMRLAEMYKLCVDDIHDTYVKVHGKGRKEREIGIHPDVGKEVWKYINRYRRSVDPAERALFIGKGGHALSMSGVREVIRRAKQASGIKDIRVTPHVFRHTFAKMYKENGGDTLNLSREMGHSSVMITERYLGKFGSTEARREHNSFSPISIINIKKGRKRK